MGIENNDHDADQIDGIIPETETEAAPEAPADETPTAEPTDEPTEADAGPSFGDFFAQMFGPALAAAQAEAHAAEHEEAGVNLHAFAASNFGSAQILRAMSTDIDHLADQFALNGRRDTARKMRKAATKMYQAAIIEEVDAEDRLDSAGEELEIARTIRDAA